MATNGPENPELATIPFVMATAAQASDVEVAMGFQGNGSMLAVKCMSDLVPGTSLSLTAKGRVLDMINASSL
jgi:predicted peroxiredoxin